MRYRFLFLLVMTWWLPAAARDNADTVQAIRPRSKANKFLSSLSIGLPTLMKLGFTTSSRNIPDNAQPHAAAQLYGGKPSKFGGALFGMPINSTSRIIAITYKNKYGLELDRCAYTCSMDFSVYNKKLQSLYPGYYVEGAKQNTSPGSYYYADQADMNCYSGWLYGAHYNIAIGKFTLQPKILAGPGSDNAGWTNNYVDVTYTYKERGSNYLLTSHVRTETMNAHKGIYIGEVSFFICSSFKQTARWRFHYEFGISAQFGLVPYNYQTSITDQPHNMPATTIVVNGTETKKIFNIAGYWTFRLSK